MSHPAPIPFNRPSLVGKEYDYIAETLREMHLSGDGGFTRKCQALLEETLGCGRALLTTSCTDALELAALLLELQPGDEVIVPSFTFVSTANAFVLHGAKPVFIDSRPDTLNLDETQLESLITDRTRAVVAVHYAGIGCEMERLQAICDAHGLTLIEDNAHGLFGLWRGRPLGTFGQIATLSFHETKNFICGEGGAILLNDRELIERAEILREKGTNRKQFYRGQVDKYTWVDVGSSFLPADLLAAFLLAQLEERETVLEKRGAVWERYHRNLQEWAKANDVRLPTVVEGATNPYHMFYLLMPDNEQRDGMIRHLAFHDIGSVFHYVPLNLSKMGRQFGGFEGQCPVCESSSDRLLRLPFFNDLSEEEVDRISDTVKTFQA